MRKLAASTKYYAVAGATNDEHEVKITGAGGKNFTLEIDGKSLEADFVKTGHNLFSLIIDNKSYEIDIYFDGTKYDILVNGDHFTVEVFDELKKMLRDRVTKGLQGRQIISTPMPGLVTKVMVKEGQEVSEGDPLLILVAMKMENQIKAPKNGIVQNLYVVPNQTVSIGDKLAIID